MGCGHQPSEEAKARHFVNTLSEVFDELKRDIANDERKNVPAATMTRAREFIPAGGVATQKVDAPVAYEASASTKKRTCYKCGAKDY